MLLVWMDKQGGGAGLGLMPPSGIPRVPWLFHLRLLQRLFHASFASFPLFSLLFLSLSITLRFVHPLIRKREKKRRKKSERTILSRAQKFRSAGKKRTPY